MDGLLNKVHCMDCIEFLKKLPDNIVDSCVTDPPYGLEFMQASWDKLGTGELVSDKDDWDWQTHRGGRGTDPLANKPRFGPVMTNTVARNRMQQWHYEWAVEVFRILKPGAHLLAFSGTRTYHRLACAIEDAGFEIRDQIHWLYGSGFPKGQNISKAIDKKYPRLDLFDEFARHYEECREISGLTHKEICERGEFYNKINHGGASSNWGLGLNVPTMKQWKILQPLLGLSLDFQPLIERIEAKREVIGKRKKLESYQYKGNTVYQTGDLDWVELDITTSATRHAKQWEGWNTQLKPAHEPIVLARKPISEKSIAENVLTHGTGAINIDACRIAVSPEVDAIGRMTKRDKRQEGAWEKYSGFLNPINPVAGVLPTGRYPANLILSHHPDCKLVHRGQTTMKMDSVEANTPLMGGKGIYGGLEGTRTVQRYDGEPEVWQCVEGCPVRILNEQNPCTGNLAGKNYRIKRGKKSGSSIGGHGIYGTGNPTIGDILVYDKPSGPARFFYCAKPSVAERSAGMNGSRNIHITVKPLSIMRWLVRLVTRRGGVVLDPFLGSGTTAIAAENEGCDWLGCDNNEEYCEIARTRIEALGGTQTTLADFKEEEKE